ncbi:BEL1-like homeodomain protein 8 [Argentina anserina]|uniref:BEL1-like homeodomain protein 8 n=1 Tax=Argentina anserina TaxID=57926 RepID=UPI00217667D6|nr:BEL1-like homeodomain protein 8 [Potentilla anserina]XP_050368642.1 BEL1-like homeodomain protein 8 [Potentilla anserina]
MEMSGFRPTESNHVAQQSRRDKLRVQPTSNLPLHHHLDHNVPNHSPAQQNPDIVQVRNVRNSNNLLFDPTLFSPELLNFSINANHAFASSPQEIGDESPQNYGNWRTLNPPQSLDNWVTNYSSGTTNHYSSGTTSNHHMFVREVNNVSPSTPSHLKPSTYHGYQNFSSPSPIYHSTLQDVVTTASTGGSTQDQLEMASWTQGYVNQSTLGLDNSCSWLDRPIGSNRHNWTGGEELRCALSDYSNQQGLSLSLSSNPPPSQGLQASTSGKSGDYLCSMMKPSIISKAYGTTKSLQDIVGSSTTSTSNAAYHRSTGPLGPFTGYATILKTSKFLKPAQQLLEDFCRVSNHSKSFKICEESERMSGDRASVSASVSASNDQAANMTRNSEAANPGRNNSRASSSAFYSFNEISSDGGAAASTSSESIRPEYQQKKAKLLYMQDEVCRKYKQYHQQMEMVVCSFESVSGLSSATPYISLALNTVSRHFKCLTGSIKDQLKHISKALGEDYSSANIASTTGSNSKSDKAVGKLKYMGLGLQKRKSVGGVDAGFPEPQQHIWRPQRGLPDRSVAILRAWLFDHFLHPYPTDTDKHMLATQTGLSRNQVSNWFINARVRVWKPMVEEIHVLETRGSMEACQDSRKDGCSPTEGTSRPSNEKLAMHHPTSSRQLESSGIGSLGDTLNADDVHQSHEIKRSRIECEVPSSMDSALMGLVPYNQTGLEVGGLGAVSLTLGLRHGVENAQQQQQQQQMHQQDEYQLRRQLGGHMIHDFVG